MKTLQKILLASGIMLFLANVAIGQNNSATVNSKKSVTPVMTKGNFVDNNKNGVCDNYEARQQSGRGANFVDKNGDGICDNRGKYGNRQGRGQGNCGGFGYQHRHGNGQGSCCGRGPGHGNGPRCNNFNK